MTRRWLRAVEVGAAVAGAAAAATAAGLAAQRAVTRARARRGEQLGFGTVHSEPMSVLTDDGVRLHVEVDELDAGAGAGAGAGRGTGRTPTLVFVHGYVLTLDCWHFQRLALRGRYRMVFYDQRSHGRSDRSAGADATVEQLGHDLARVIEEVVPDGPVVLIGHSMGGMALMHFAEQRPDLVADRVAGVAFLASSAGGAGRLVPGPVGRALDAFQPFVLGSLARVPVLVDASRHGTGFAFTGRLAFGGPVPDSYVVFVDEMIGATPSQVIWDFLPSVRLHRGYQALAAYADVPALVVAGGADAILPVRHSERLAAELPLAELVVLEGAGHMLVLEQPDAVNVAIEDLVARGATAGAGR